MPHWLELVLTALVAALAGGGGVALLQMLRGQRAPAELAYNLPELDSVLAEAAQERQAVQAQGEAAQEEVQAALADLDPEGAVVDLLNRRRE